MDGEEILHHPRPFSPSSPLEVFVSVSSVILTFATTGTHYNYRTGRSSPTQLFYDCSKVLLLNAYSFRPPTCTHSTSREGGLSCAFGPLKRSGSSSEAQRMRLFRCPFAEAALAGFRRKGGRGGRIRMKAGQLEVFGCYGATYLLIPLGGF